MDYLNGVTLDGIQYFYVILGWFVSYVLGEWMASHD